MDRKDSRLGQWNRNFFRHNKKPLAYREGLKRKDDNMPIRKYRVFNYTKKEFDTLTTSAILEVGQFVVLPQGELQIFNIIKVY